MQQIQKLIEEQQKLIEILKPMTPKERFEYNKKCLYEKKDWLLQKIDDLVYSNQANTYKDISNKYINTWSTHYDISPSEMKLGGIYTFSYPKEASVEISIKGTIVPSKRLPFFDIQPFIIYAGWHIYEGTGRQIITGINLNFLPPDINFRIKLLNLFIEEYKDTIYSDDKERYSEFVNMNFMAFYQQMADTLRYLRMDYVVRRYWVENMFAVRQIQRKDLPKIAIMDTSRLIGTFPQNVYNYFNRR